MSKRLLLVLLTACVANDELDELASPVIGSTSTLARYTVDIGDCSGILLNPRWILTTARCIGSEGLQPRTIYHAPTAGTHVLLYNGTVDTFVHLESSSSDVPSEYAPHDLGLIHLFDRGIDMTALGIPQPPLYTDARLPGHAQTNSAVRQVGWGNSGASCTGDSALRITSPYQVDPLTAPYLTAPAAPAGACSGDRGGPLLAMRGGMDLVAALYAGSATSTSYATPAATPTNLGWIEATIAAETPGAYLPSPSSGMTSDGYSYRYENILAKPPQAIRTPAGSWFGCLAWGSSTSVVVDVCGKMPTQKWVYSPTGAVLTAEAAPRCLTVVDGTLQTAACNGSVAQRFYIDRDAVDHLRSTVDGRCVHSAGINVAGDVQPCGDENTFSFQFQ